jgi:hypothetical protein
MVKEYVLGRIIPGITVERKKLTDGELHLKKLRCPHLDEKFALWYVSNNRAATFSSQFDGLITREEYSGLIRKMQTPSCFDYLSRDFNRKMQITRKEIKNYDLTIPKTNQNNYN